ncbi:hypothetical protein CXG81DRAFT_27080 [Caulochytrium protostelioides]|uniref:Uncharacterized protein n=1 Tax=Caulochytrium protostelioides TaxID=1555241 RepID=A0A4P9X524_9FUNG|nr:hypothetical protein CXG81DRAFT_27080 [Caulochytrium protostelioides]|eukprot:RKP00185.1 hypothetical protein CXG81DRAFT_27080 [Caulochytrium protostelioides]
MSSLAKPSAHPRPAPGADASKPPKQLSDKIRNMRFMRRGAEFARQAEMDKAKAETAAGGAGGAAQSGIAWAAAAATGPGGAALPPLIFESEPSALAFAATDVSGRTRYGRKAAGGKGGVFSFAEGLIHIEREKRERDRAERLEVSDEAMAARLRSNRQDGQQLDAALGRAAATDVDASKSQSQSQSKVKAKDPHQSSRAEKRRKRKAERDAAPSPSPSQPQPGTEN